MKLNATLRCEESENSERILRAIKLVPFRPLHQPPAVQPDPRYEGQNKALLKCLIRIRKKKVENVALFSCDERDWCVIYDPFDRSINIMRFNQSPYIKGIKQRSINA